uniref:E3 ubiquitin-protein ligase n=1 Tax=Albugo laibachii Nc14 TaxID=890382 RepID=F0WCV9_9STRA|nr:conserved hypothetical protein [Albugo laibachii Nc14]|eukprot:CCA19030.1 conserved hypothetical protein [Albugo laibachii Nc14]
MQIDDMSTESTAVELEQLLALWSSESLDRFCTHYLPSFLHTLYHNASENALSDSELVHFLTAILSIPTPIKSDSGLKPPPNDPKRKENAYCGYIFQKNDLAFNCKTCQADETCVICLHCYEHSDHQGHEIYFHTTLPGGICDCGDAEAWKPSGFCVSHRQDPVEEDTKELLTLSSLAKCMGNQSVTSQHPEDWMRASSVRSVRSLSVEEYKLTTHLFSSLIKMMSLMADQIVGSFDVARVTMQGRKDLEHWNKRENVQANERNLAKIFHLRISNDDIHSDNELVHSLIEKRISSARQLTNTIDTQGSTIIWPNMSLYEATELMQAFQVEGWHVSVISERHLAQERLVLAVLKWLQKCVSTESYQILFCQQLLLLHDHEDNSPPLKTWLLSDPYYRKELAFEMYEFYLKLQTEKAIKTAFSWTFMTVYEPLMIRYISGIGTQRESIFQYGVQLFTTPSIVTAIHNPNDIDILKLLITLLHSALEIAQVCVSEASSTIFTCDHLEDTGTPTPKVLDCGHFVLKYSRYTYLLDHLGYVLNIPEMAREMLLRDDILELWLSLLRQTQHLNAQKWIDETQAHVTFESHDWHAAFSFRTQLTRVCVTLSQALHPDDIPRVFECIWKQLQASRSIMSFIRKHWKQESKSIFTTEAKSMVQYDMSGSDMPVSFHYPLHTMFGLFLRQLIRSGEQEMTHWWALIESNGGRKIDSEVISALFEFPLRTLVFAAHIQSGLWVRNGQIMIQQATHYTSLPWCSSFRDMDVFLMQLAADTLKKNVFLSMFFHRFGLTNVLENLSTAREYFQDTPCARLDAEKIITLLENALLTLLWIVTQTPASPDDLRREIVHKLAVEPRTRSQLLEKTSLPHAPESVDAILTQVADRLPGRSISDPSRYTLKMEAWKTEYDPVFFHISRPDHEKAQQNRHEALFRRYSKEDDPIPLVSNLYPPFTLHDITLNKSLLGIVRSLLEIAVHKASGDADASTSRLCSGVVITHALHLLNIAILTICRTKDFQTLESFRAGPKELLLINSKGVKRQRVTDENTCDPVHEGSLLALLHRYSQLLSGDSHVKATISIINWILMKLHDLDEASRAYLLQHAHAIPCAISKKQMQKMHQQNAMDAMRARQLAFATSSDLTMESMDHSDDENVPECIICAQHKPNASIMYIGFKQSSKIAAHISDSEPSSRIFISLCGHAVHLNCWEEYMTSMRPPSRLSTSANVAFDPFASEFLCPMCQSLSSILIPFIQPMESDPSQEAFSVFSWLNGGLLHRLNELSRRKSVRKEAMEMFAKAFDANLEPEKACHLMWNAVASTWTLLQLHGISMAISMNAMEKHLSQLHICENVSETALGIALPHDCEQHLDPTPRDDNMRHLFSALSSAHVLFHDEKSAISHFEVLLKVLQPNAKPLFHHDLFYLTVAICGSMLFHEAEVLLTIKSFTVLCMAQTALQIAQFEKQMDIPCEESEEEALDRFMERLCHAAGLPFTRFGRFRWKLFVCNMSRHLRQMTMLFRAISKDANACMRLSSNWKKLTTQLGIPSVAQVLHDEDLMEFLQTHASRGVDNVSLPIRMKPPMTYATISLTPLPSSFVTLYARIMPTLCPSTQERMENPAMCLICGEVVCGGTDCCRKNHRGACTRHSSVCGDGIGCFLLLRSTWTLLMDGARSCYFASVYVDAFDEDDVYLRRGRPLHLSAVRLHALCKLYGSHQFRQFVSRDRQTSEQFIRNNYF